MEFYLKYRESRPAAEFDPVLRAEAERREAERRRDLVTIRLSSLVQKQARTIGPESVCRSTLSMLKVREFLNSRGWSREQVDLALMQIIARAIYPYSELKTVRYLQGNSALLEMFRLDRRKVTKDALYQSAERLWEVHREMEDFLHERVTNMFHLEEKILLLDITNTYFEGRMEHSGLCFYGRSKEKRDDCKIVVLAAVVNTDGLLVRTMIYEGNRGGRHAGRPDIARGPQDSGHGRGLLLRCQREMARREPLRLHHRAAFRLCKIHRRQRQGGAP